MTAIISEIGVTAIARLAGFSETTAIRWHSVIRGSCVFRVNAGHRTGGGPGLVVEIDELALCKLKENN